MNKIILNYISFVKCIINNNFKIKKKKKRAYCYPCDYWTLQKPKGKWTKAPIPWQCHVAFPPHIPWGKRQGWLVYDTYLLSKVIYSHSNNYCNFRNELWTHWDSQAVTTHMWALCTLNLKHNEIEFHVLSFTLIIPRGVDMRFIAMCTSYTPLLSFLTHQYEKIFSFYIHLWCCEFKSFLSLRHSKLTKFSTTPFIKVKTKLIVNLYTMD